MASPIAYSSSGARISLVIPMDVDYGEGLHSPYVVSSNFSQPVTHRSAGGTVLDHSLHDLPSSVDGFHVCLACQKVFTTAGHLTRHVKVHSGDKPFVCPYPSCAKSCTRQDNLIQHYRIHMGNDEKKARDSGTVRTALRKMRDARKALETHPETVVELFEQIQGSMFDERTDSPPFVFTPREYMYSPRQDTYSPTSSTEMASSFPSPTGGTVFFSTPEKRTRWCYTESNVRGAVT